MTPAAVASPVDDHGRNDRLQWTAAMTGAVVVSLVRPLSWALGLAGFLAGGGLLLVTAPVAVLPTPSGVQNTLGAPVSRLVLSTPAAGILALAALAAAGTLLIVLAATLAGAWAERHLVGVALEAAAEEGIVGSVDPGPAPGTGSVAVIRLLGLVPVVVVALLAWPTVYDAAYHQLVLPDELVTPLPLRVLRAVPLPVLLLGVTWLVSDAAAAVGVRRLLIERRSVSAAWRLGWTDLGRRPLRILGTAIVGLAALVLLVAPALLAAGTGWSRVREVLADGGDPVVAMATVAIWVAIWLGGLVLAGVGAAIRAAAWTLESAHRA